MPKDTIKFNNFTLARSNNNDLYMLIYSLKHGKEIKDPKNIRNRIMFVERTYVDFLRKISRASLGLDDYAQTYFVRLEKINC